MTTWMYEYVTIRNHVVVNNFSIYQYQIIFFTLQLFFRTSSWNRNLRVKISVVVFRNSIIVTLSPCCVQAAGARGVGEGSSRDQGLQGEPPAAATTTTTTAVRLDSGKSEFDKRWGYETLECIKENVLQQFQSELGQWPLARLSHFLNRWFVPRSGWSASRSFLRFANFLSLLVNLLFQSNNSL